MGWLVARNADNDLTYRKRFMDDNHFKHRENKLEI